MRKVKVANEELLPQIVDILTEGKQVILKARGQSMLPFIVGDCDSVVLQKKDAEYSELDIVLAEPYPNLFVIHRILKIDGEIATLMGDGNISNIEICKKNNIHGYVSQIIKADRKIDPNSPNEIKKAKIWSKLLPFRKYLLAFYRRFFI